MSEALCPGCRNPFTSPDDDPRCSSCAESGTGPEPPPRMKKILGVAPVMSQPGERRYEARFGALEAGYACIPNFDGSESAPFSWWVRLVKHECPRSPVLGSERTAAAAIAALERELLAIRAAIPDPQPAWDPFGAKGEP